MIRTPLHPLDSTSRTDDDVNESCRSSGRHGDILLASLDLVLYALWLGGLVVIGAVVAPVAFTVLRHALNVPLPQSNDDSIAGAVVGGSFRVYNVIALVCGMWFTARAWIISRRQSSLSMRMLVLGPAFLTLVLTCGEMLVLLPSLDRAKALGQSALSNKLHRSYELMFWIQMLVLILFAFGYASCVRREQAS